MGREEVCYVSLRWWWEMGCWRDEEGLAESKLTLVWALQGELKQVEQRIEKVGKMYATRNGAGGQGM